MEEILQKQLLENGRQYKTSLDRIIDKYSKLQYQDGGLEVDLDNTNMKTLERYMKLSKKKLNKLESKSHTDLEEESLDSQDITSDSQLDITHQEGGAHETSTHLLFAKDDAMSTSESTELTVSSLDESQRNISETELQPEDQDDELEMSLRSHGSSLVELYPNMISQIERAWRRQHVSEAAGSVLRRYRKLRHPSNRSSLSTTFNTTLRQTSSNPKKTNRKTLVNETVSSPLKRRFSGNRGTEPAPLSPVRIVNHVQDWQTQHHHHHSPGKGRGLQRREQHPSALVMNFSSCPSKPEKFLLNKTFTVSQLSPQRPQPPAYTVSPSRPCYPTTNASRDVSFRSKGSSLSPHIVRAAGCSTCESESTASKEKPDLYGSPVRQSPFKARLMTNEGFGSPHAFSVSPKSYAQSYSRELKRPRSVSTSLSSPPQSSPASQRMFYYQDPSPSFQSQLRLPQSNAAAGRHGLRRHLSFDSSCMPSSRVSYSAKELDNDFTKLYHKFVCQSKSSSFIGPPCRMCAKSSEASRGHSSSALAALALSPHRSILRKRHRELSWDSRPQSKRSREGYCTYSPGSKRYGREMLARRFPPSELESSHGSSRMASVNMAWLQNSAPRKSGGLEETRPAYVWS